jgi:phosphoenolpyruvate synthase/pyruvate phosphate dikinase
MTAVQTSPLCLPLDATEATRELVGGKGASLARLVAAGLPVPPGFHLTTAAYRRFVEGNALQAAIVMAAAGAAAHDPTSLERASAAIRERFAGGAMPAAVAAALCQAYTELGGDDLPVVVRSSATAEDLPELSFAGQQETYLNVRGEAALLDAVRRCWASLWTARAIGYRRRMGIDDQSVAMGVVVQVLVPSEVAGVLFTANPTTGARDELVVNASFGLGEAVVAGEVTPDSYRLDKASLALREVTLGTKHVTILPSDGQGTTTQPVPEGRRTEQALADADLLELGRLALQVEAQFGGGPQDIEWAVTGGRC